MADKPSISAQAYAEWKQAKDAGQDPAAPVIHKQFIAAIKAAEDGSRCITFTITTQAPDRERDVVHSDGVVLDNYLKNPVVLFAHDYRSLPVARCISLERSEGKISATAEFATADLNPMAEQVFRMIKGGFLNACSIGFKPMEWNYDDERRGVNFLTSELLEYSVVPVPAHPQALVEARAAGIDVSIVKEWAEAALAQFKADAEAEAAKTRKATLVDVRKAADAPNEFAHDAIGWKAFAKARDRALRKDEQLGDAQLLDLLGDYGFEAEAATLRDAVVVEPAVTEQPAAGEEEAETVAYQTLGTLLAQAAASVAEAAKVVQAMLAAESGEQGDEAAEEPVEAAQLAAVQALCTQAAATLSAVCSLACAMCDDEADGTDVPTMAMSAALEAVLAKGAALQKAGARHSKVDTKMIQDAHDLLMALGAACPKSEPEPVEEDAAAGAVLRLTEDTADVVLRLSPEPEPVMTFDPKALAEEIRSALGQLVVAESQRQIDALRGRVTD